MNKEINPLQQAINNLLNGKTQLKKKKLKKHPAEKTLFVNIIKAWKESLDRETFLTLETGTNLSEHNNLYYKIISDLVTYKFGPETSELIHFYIYESQNPDGTINYLKDENGNVIKLETPENLWELIQKINSTIQKNNK